MKLSRQSINAVFDCLYLAYGPQRWWPAETPFEVMVGAVLTQNTAWSNVERAIVKLAQAGLRSPELVLEADLPNLAGLLRPAGYFNVKARRLKNFIDFFLPSSRAV